MTLAKNIYSKRSSTKNRRMGIKESFGNPEFILEQLSSSIRDGDFDSSTDLISAYISNSKKYNNQDDFAMAIGTTRQTLHRMFR